MELLSTGDHHDVVIAGAGPAGAQCARDLAARNFDVVVLEAESEDEFPARSDKSTGGTFPAMLNAFDVPNNVIMNRTTQLVLESPSEHYAWRLGGAILDFAAFKRFLVEDGREKGAEYRFDARVSGPIMDDGAVVGVRYAGDEEVYGDVVVDATGPSAVLAEPLGLCDLQRANHAVGIEYEFEGVTVDHPDYADLTGAMMFRLDREYAPGGYAWIFHTGGDEAKVGVCYLHPTVAHRHAEEGHTIDDHLDHWLESDPRFEDADRIEGTARRGSAHIQSPDRLSTDGFMAIGDTVPTVDALWGEGIHKSMKSGRAAADTAEHCLRRTVRDTSAETISVYDDMWHEEVAPRARSRLRASKLLYRLPDERFDTLLADLNRLEYETLLEASYGDPRAMAKLVHLGDVPLLATMALGTFADRLGRIRTRTGTPPPRIGERDEPAD